MICLRHGEFRKRFGENKNYSQTWLRIEICGFIKTMKKCWKINSNILDAIFEIHKTFKLNLSKSYNKISQQMPNSTSQGIDIEMNISIQKFEDILFYFCPNKY